MSDTDKNTEMCLEACRGNESAAQFMDIVTEVLHFFDDVVDEDHELTAGQVERACWNALVELPRNMFYMQHFSVLNPVLAMAIQDWCVANEFEADGSEAKLRIAFIVRSSYVNLLVTAATIVGGFDWGRSIALRARELWHDEGWDGYNVNLQKQFDDAAKLRGR
jgi:hypothetical protein